MTDQTPPPMPPLPVLGPEGETCSSCQAQLAIDQRYCLECGARRAASRVDFAGLLPAQPASAPAPGGTTVTETTTVGGAVVPAPMGAQGPWTPFAMVASIAVLALMLLVGVMIGKDDDPTQVTAAAPVAPVAATAAPTDAATGVTGADASAGGAGGASGAGDSAKASTGTGGGGGGGGGGTIDENPPPAESAEGAVAVDDEALDALGATDPEDYSEASKNLPDTIAIPGEPPPVDNEEPGGGTKAETIG